MPKARIAAALAFVLALAFGIWGLWRVWWPSPDNLQGRLDQALEQGQRQGAQIERLRQRVATLKRSDQISRDANSDLQGTLARRDAQIAKLRADIAFYKRLVGATAKRHGLTVHALDMQPQGGPSEDGSVWHFTTTLTQNLDRDAVSSGALTLSIEGTRDEQLQVLQWPELRQQPADEAQAVDYSFKYFQEVEGDVLFPPGFTPVEVTVHLDPDSGSDVEHAFTWAEARRGIREAE